MTTISFIILVLYINLIFQVYCKPPMWMFEWNMQRWLLWLGNVRCDVFKRYRCKWRLQKMYFFVYLKNRFYFSVKHNVIAQLFGMEIAKQVVKRGVPNYRLATGMLMSVELYFCLFTFYLKIFNQSVVCNANVHWVFVAVVAVHGELLERFALMTQMY